MGHRTRILYKLQEDALVFKMSQLSENAIQEKRRSYSGAKRAPVFEIRTDDREESCKCAIF